jgi:hypothetical protein
MFLLFNLINKPMKIFTRLCAGFAALLLFSTLNINGQVNTQIPLSPKVIPQFVDPLPHFAGVRVDATAGGDLQIKMVPHDQIALSTGTVINGGVIDPKNNPSLGKAHLWV